MLSAGSPQVLWKSTKLAWHQAAWRLGLRVTQTPASLASRSILPRVHALTCLSLSSSRSCSGFQRAVPRNHRWSGWQQTTLRNTDGKGPIKPQMPPETECWATLESGHGPSLLMCYSLSRPWWGTVMSLGRASLVDDLLLTLFLLLARGMFPTGVR